MQQYLFGNMYMAICKNVFKITFLIMLIYQLIQNLFGLNQRLVSDVWCLVSCLFWA